MEHTPLSHLYSEATTPYLTTHNGWNSAVQFKRCSSIMLARYQLIHRNGTLAPKPLCGVEYPHHSVLLQTSDHSGIVIPPRISSTHLGETNPYSDASCCSTSDFSSGKSLDESIGPKRILQFRVLVGHQPTTGPPRRVRPKPQVQ